MFDKNDELFFSMLHAIRSFPFLFQKYIEDNEPSLKIL